MFIGIGKCIGLGEMEGFEIYKSAWKETSENLQSLKLA